jgi:multidrug transporter EmrE-like cation transporter
MATALDMNVPGNIVFPVTSGGAILAVGVAGRVFFKERMNRMTTVGIVLGFLAVILLSIS